MTFDQWMRRPVYVVHCYTSRIARTMSVCTPDSLFRFRALRQYRNISANLLRRATAAKILEMRRQGLICAAQIRRDHERLLQSPSRGEVWTGDLEKILRE